MGRYFLRFLLLAALPPSSPARAAKLEGYIWDIRGATVIVEGQEVHLMPSTRVERSRHPGISIHDLRIGWEVEVEYDSGEPVRAREIKVKNERLAKIEIDGFVDGFNEESVKIEGRTVHWSDGLRRENIVRGARIEAKGRLLDDGSVQLEEFELRPPGLDDNEREFLDLASREVAGLRGKLEFYDDRVLEEYVHRVGQSLVPDWVDRKEFQFDFLIVDDPELNAYALPDGTIVIHSGLLAVLESEAQLASVLGHEIAHVTHRHAYRGYRRAEKWQWVAWGAGVAGAAIDGAEPWSGPSLNRVLLEVGASLAISAAVNGHGRNLEDDADRIGLRYVLDAGYDPFQAPEVWQIFNRHVQDQNAVTNWFFSDHSTHRARISNLTREINSNYRGAIDPSHLTRNEKEYGRMVGRLRRNVAIRNYERKEYEAARLALQRVLEDHPEDAVAHLYMGKILWDTGGAREADRALAEYRTAIELDPRLAEPYREMGFLYRGIGETEKALEAFRTYLSVAPDAEDAESIHQLLREMNP